MHTNILTQSPQDVKRERNKKEGLLPFFLSVFAIRKLPLSIECVYNQNEFRFDQADSKCIYATKEISAVSRLTLSLVQCAF